MSDTPPPPPTPTVPPVVPPPVSPAGRPRAEVSRQTAGVLREKGPILNEIPTLVGFDGFVDNICSVVDTRSDANTYVPVPTIARFAQKLAAAAGRSANYEVVVRRQKLGGNGPIMANALASMGMDVTYVGNLGDPDIHPVFHDFARLADVRSVAAPGETDALEFEDGKLMLGKLDPLEHVTWERINAKLGAETFEHLLARSRLVAMVNWTMIPGLSRLFARLAKDVLPHLPAPQGEARMIFVDLADPEKRTRDDLLYALKLLGKMQEHAQVHFGMNLKESLQVADVLGLDVPESAGSAADIAASVREALGLTCCVVHPRAGAGAATAGDKASFAGPFVQHPKISTGAGDHFNAGFMLGRLLGLPLDGCLCTGVATSGFYVRTARSPSAADLAEFVADLPPPEDKAKDEA